MFKLSFIRRLYGRLTDKVGYALVAGVLALSPLHATAADDHRALIVTDSLRPPYQLFISEIKKQLASRGQQPVHIRVVEIADWRAETSEAYPLSLTLGNNSALTLSQHRLSRPVIYGLLPSANYHQAIGSTPHCGEGRCSAVFIDQPLTRTLALTRLALPRIKTLGLLTGPDSTNAIEPLRTLAATQGLRVEHQPVMDPDNLVFDLTTVLKKSEALLSLPDAHIYSRHSAQNILLTAYRYRKPVIGYSAAFVKAGALFAVYSTPAQLSRQTAEMMRAFFFGGTPQLPPAQYPRYYTVSVNHMVAKSLGIQMQNEAILQEQLEAARHE
ncbi:MAG: ABC transporter substrate binding protein [Gammaproteobacteria bacterium]